MTTVVIVLAGLAIFFAGPLLIGWLLSRPYRCCSCHRRLDHATDIQLIGWTGRLICHVCLRTITPRVP